jgi:hypothetical protein
MQQHQQQMTRLRYELKVEPLLKRGRWDSDTHETLNNLLKVQLRTLLAEALHAWANDKENKKTWLTDAVEELQFEVVAILLYHSADAHQQCPLPVRHNLTAFDGISTLFHTRNSNLTSLMATLLNNNNDRLGLRPIDIAMRIRKRSADETRLKQKMLQYLQQYLQQGELALALMMSHQPRLGHASPLQHLFPDKLGRNHFFSEIILENEI